MAKQKGTHHKTTEQRLADAEVRLNKLREQARKNDTRRRILIGSMYLSQAEECGALNQLLTRLDNWLPSGHRDRRLWIDHGLGPIRGLFSATLHPAEQPSPGWAAKEVLFK